jgi:glycosyltransferase involved in cell wall biosynthesis
MTVEISKTHDRGDIKNAVGQIKGLHSVKIDVAVRTFNSGRYLDVCLSGIEQAFDVNDLIIIDHFSTDGTIEIARQHKANIIFENQGIGYALELAVRKTSTPIFAIIDSDVELKKGKWVDLLFRKFEDPTVGGVGLRMYSDIPLWRKKYNAFWLGVRDFKQLRGGEWVNAYVVRKNAVPNFRVPKGLDSWEHGYLKDTIIRKGFKISFVDTNGEHHYGSEAGKGRALGAGERIYSGLQASYRSPILTKVLLSPFKAIPPAIAYKDPNVILGNTRYWFEYLEGYLHPQKYMDRAFLYPSTKVHGQ